jgi:hypothetical protein
MSRPDDDHGGVNTPHSAALTGIANLFRLVFVTVALAIAWLGAVFVTAYYSWSAADGSYFQSLATNSLAGLILLLVAPVLFSVVLRKSPRYAVAVAIAAGLVLVGAAFAGGALRDVLLNLGIGLWFVLAIDFNIVHRFKMWTARLQGEAREAAEDIHLVL